MFSRYFSFFCGFYVIKTCILLFYFVSLPRKWNKINWLDDEKTFYITICTFDNIAFDDGTGYIIWYYRCGDG